MLEKFSWSNFGNSVSVAFRGWFYDLFAFYTNENKINPDVSRKSVSEILENLKFKMAAKM